MSAQADVEALNDGLHEVLAQLEIVSPDRRAAVEEEDEIHRSVTDFAERKRRAQRGDNEHRARRYRDSALVPKAQARGHDTETGLRRAKAPPGRALLDESNRKNNLS